MKCLVLLTYIVIASAINSEAAVIDFENFAPVGNLVNINPQFPYAEKGFTLTPSNSASAVFDPLAISKFPGDNTAWFGFAAGNTITLTGPSPFDLDGALIGPSTIGSGITSLMIIGHVVDGSLLNVTFSNLTTATQELIGFDNLVSATFFATTDSGMDNISVTLVPEPVSLFLIGFGLLIPCAWLQKLSSKRL